METGSHFIHQLLCILINLGGNSPETFESVLPKEGSDWLDKSERQGHLNVLLNTEYGKTWWSVAKLTGFMCKNEEKQGKPAPSLEDIGWTLVQGKDVAAFYSANHEKQLFHEEICSAKKTKMM